MIIGVTSLNNDKLRPTINVFTKFFPNRYIGVFGKKCPSLINEQPEGHQEILQGATNRIFSFENTPSEQSPDYIVSYENGVVSFDIFGEKEWYDLVWVIVKNCSTGQTSCAFGQGVRFPSQYVSEAKALGFDKHTVGSIIAKHHPSADPSDPDYFLTNGKVKRSDLLENALTVALAQLLNAQSPE